jgi:PAS domain S-box-containing protein
LQKGIDSSKSMTIFEGDVLKLLHELEVYQIELALSNEELVLARDQAEALSRKHTALFDFAPMGYLTIDKAATISELNFSAAKMLGEDRSALLGKDLKIYFNINDLPRFSAFVIQVFYSKTKQICELKLKRSEKNARAFCRLEGVVDVDGNCMIALIDISQGKNDENALRKAHDKAEESKKYLNSIMNKIGDPFFVKDEQSRLLLANDSFCKLFGVPKKDIIGKTLAEDVSAVEREHFLKIDKQVIATGKENIIEESLTLKGQKTQTISTRKTRYVDTEGQKFLIGTIRDVTEQKKAANKLRQSSQLLEASQAAAHVGGWELNLASGDLFWTAETYRIHDTSPEEFEPTTDAGVHYYLPESRDIITEALRGATEEGKGYDLELEIRTQKGRLIQVRTTCEVTLQEGRASRLTGIFQDITDQKLAEISLKRSKVKFEKLSNLTFEGIVIHKDGIITDHNASFTRLFGYNKESFIGQNGTELFIHPSKHQSVYDKLKEHITRPYTSVGIKKDGTEFPIEIEGKEFIDESGVAYRVTAIRDITERVAHEAKLKESEEFIRSIVENSLNGILVADDHGNPLLANKAAAKMFGYNKEELIKMNVKQIYKSTNSNGGETNNLFLGKNYEKGEFEFLRNKEPRVVEYQEVRVRDNFNLRILSDITERKNLEIEQKKLLKQSDLAINTAKLGVWIHDVVANKLEWNDKLLEIVGLSREEFKGEVDGYVQYVHPEDIDYITGLQAEVFTGRSVIGAEYRIIRKDGEIRYIEGSASPVYNDSNDLTQLIGVASDITDRKSQETELIRSKLLLQSSIESPNGMIIISLDTKYNYLYFNSEHAANMQQIYGTKPKIGKCIFDYLPSVEEIKRLKINYEKALKGESHMDISQYGEGNASVYFETRYSPILNNQKKIIGITAFAQNITDRSKMQKLLLDSEEKFRNAINYAPYPLMIHADGKVLQLSEEWIKQTGYTIDDIPTIQKWSLVAYGNDAILSEAYINNLYNLEQPQLDGEWEVKIKDGSYVLWNFSSSSIGKLPNGKKMVISMASDISEINKYKEQLEELVEERTTDLELRTKELNKTNEELIFAQSEMHKALFKEKELGELKSQFVSTASHQFRTPLTVIQSNVELMEMNLHSLEESTRNRFEKSIERINNETHRMTALMNDVLLLGKINAHADISNHEWINITTTTRDLIGRLNEINTIYAKINLEVIGEPKEIFLDENQYSHILLNVLGNAQKYSLDRGDVTFQVRFEKEKVKLVIIDQGIGMSEEDTKRIFNPFSRGKNAEGIQGTGLGMSIVHEYVKLNHGTIEIESQLNIGTTVVISFTYNEK